MFCAAITCFAHALPENVATTNSNVTKFNGSGVTYTCKDGFSFNPNDVNDRSRTVHCQAHGSLEELSPADCTGKYVRLLPLHRFFDWNLATAEAIKSAAVKKKIMVLISRNQFNYSCGNWSLGSVAFFFCSSR